MKSDGFLFSYGCSAEAPWPQGAREHASFKALLRIKKRKLVVELWNLWATRSVVQGPVGNP